MKNLYLKNQFFAMMIFIIFSLPIFAQGALSGNMVDIFHNPISNTMIKLVGGNSDVVFAKLKTGNDGQFRFEDVEPGVYFIELKSEECETFRSEKIVMKPRRNALNFASVMMDGCVRL